eukprot:Nk52_evm46s2531 gene=Nk52_evmTU46s2531
MYENDFSLKATARDIVGSADIHRLMTPSFVNLKFLRWTTMHFTAPLLEEIVFRGCVCAILLIGIRHQSQVDNSDKGAHDMVYIAPLFFGMAHMHHVFDHIYSLGMSVRNATLTVLFQLCYTTLFGMLATYYFVRTGLVMAPFLSHVFCNFMGFPDFAAAANKPTNAARIIGAMYLVGESSGLREEVNNAGGIDFVYTLPIPFTSATTILLHFSLFCISAGGSIRAVKC